ncbi:MSHA biogenesis protein MshQ [Vibrio sp. 03-59-1]|uniref:DUF6701 domain-containing protein n=1 Tax=Vibrio sp. 03-59-1 TaxID=2607607 RepID=UPI0014934BFA|nr:DUF6701 domain-containing protein [Vibrio sp. 03-59-1]NOH83627.1 MSHA biogenesis protein MshQ [Vibrio sp. 03-59-1]
MSFQYSYLRKKTLESARKIKWLGIALSCFWSFFASASDDFSLENCSDLKRQDGFSITFTVPNPNPVTVTLSSNKLLVDLWSSVKAATIQDTDVTPGQRVLLTYTPEASDGKGKGNGKSGTLSYKLDSGSGFKDKSSAEMAVNGGNGTLMVSGDNSEVSCADGDVTPPPPPLPPINTNPKFEFGTIDSSACTINSLTGTDHDHNGDGSNDHDNATVTCVLTFDKTYTGETPLVFVMPTIDASLSNKGTETKKKTTEYPSTLRVHDVTNSQAVISQKIAPHRKASSSVNFVPAPMQSIDYFVIEPGVLDLSNGSRIVAGSVNTNTACGKKNGCNKQLINYTDFGAPNPFSGSASEAPGVLVEIQTQNNKLADGEPRWITGAADNVSKNSFNLFLERSEVGANIDISSDEKVAFVAGLGQGYVSGLKFWLGSATTLNTTGFTEKVVQPIVDGCAIYTNFPDTTSFDSVPTLVGTKNSRDGNDGGWLRRCDVKKDKVAFIVEEDMEDVERRHKQEVASFFMFEKPPAQAVCNLFPSPAQTWNGNSSASLLLDNNAKIIGAPVTSGHRNVGFYQADITGTNQGIACDGKACVGSSGLMVEKPELESFQIPTNPALENISLWDEPSPRVFKNNEVIGSLAVGRGSKVIFKSGVYWVKKIDINNGGIIEIPDGEEVLIHVQQLNLSSRIERDASPSKFEETGSGSLQVFVHSYTGSQVDFNSRTEFTGLLYSEVAVSLSNEATVNGAVTARSIDMHNDAQIIATDNKCFKPFDDYKVTITPDVDLALMCGDDVPVFTINTTNNDETESLSVTVEVDPNANRFNVTAEPDFGSGSYPNFTSNSSGVLKLKVTPKNTSNTSLSTNYNLSVTMDDDTSQSVKSQFKFVPFKFEVPDQTVIAGKDNDVTTTVLACSDTGKTKVETYSGTPSISYEVKKPDPTLAKKGVLTYAPVFTSGDKGAREDMLKISESGEFLVTLTDDKFDCTGLSGCPIDGGGKLTGSFTIKSRPWKIAICDVKAADESKNNPAKTNEIGGYFISANSDFKATFKPIVHSDFYTTPRDECSYQTTYNYFTETGHAAPFKVSFDLTYPSLGTLSNLASDKFSGDFSFSASDKVTTSRQKTINFSWEDVGSLLMKSDADYLSMNLEQDTQVIGRFYPDYFNITQSTWTAPDKQGGSTYMGQPFQSVAFEVKAYNSTGDETKNYGSFDEVLKASFYLRGDKSDRVSILDSELDASHWGNKTGIWSRSWTDAKWNRIGAGAKITTPDGPYNSTWVGDVKTTTELSLSLDSSGDGNSNHTDPTLFKVTGTDGTISKAASQLLAAQPDVRYGRMRLQDVGGNQGYSVRVPLSIEYWRAGSFVLNAKDSNSRFDTSNNMQCNHIEWSEITPAVSDAKLANTLNPVSDDGSVDKGESLSIYARQATSRREQVRLFLRQGSIANPDGVTCSWSTGIQPWLIYNWRNKGDEDPSAVVTFGINRGNDRIIFRNEPGLTN